MADEKQDSGKTDGAKKSEPKNDGPKNEGSPFPRPTMDTVHSTKLPPVSRRKRG